MVGLQDFADVGDTAVFIDERQIEFMEQQMMERGYLDNRYMSNMFSLLRVQRLIWSAVVTTTCSARSPAFDSFTGTPTGRVWPATPTASTAATTYPREQPYKAGQGRDKGRPLTSPG